MKMPILAAAMALLAGCSTLEADYIPRLDPGGRDSVQVSDDISECQAIAYHRTNPYNLMAGVTAGATVGLLAAPAGIVTGEVAGAAAVGTAVGTSRRYEFFSSRATMTRDCLQSRGYKLLD